jgi:tRNA(adenine34) deaminase
MRILRIERKAMIYPIFSHEYFMQEALKEAKKAMEQDEVPIGAVIVAANRIIGRGYNQTESLNDVTAHAEMLAFTSAANTINSKYLNECILYVTLEPCIMCAGAAYWTQIGQIVYGTSDPKRGFSIHVPSPLHPSTILLGGILEHECSVLVKDFFKKKR